MYLGWKKDNPALQRGVQWIGQQGPAPGDMYYNYYAAQVMRHWGGEPWRQWDAVMNVNVKGIFFLCQQVAPIMKDQGGGSIINVTSYLGMRTEENLGPYCISKAAVMHMTRVMAREWGRWNVRVNAIAPAWVHSRLSDPFLQMPGVNDRMLSQTVIGRFGEPDDVAAIALYLASDAAANQTAGIFPLDYGMLT